MMIELQNASFAYGAQAVLEDVSVCARPGRVTTLLGPNAAGKTTMLRGIIGALRPSAGTVLVGGRPARALRGRELASALAYVGQRPRVSADFTVRQVVELGRFALPRDHDRVERTLASLELHGLADRSYAALSAGQQQRVALARALAQVDPGGALILDEPTASMDLRRAGECYALLKRLAAEGYLVLITLHDLTTAAQIAEDVWLLESGSPGRLRAAGAAEDVFQLDVLAAVFGVPFRWVYDAEGGRLLSPTMVGTGTVTQ